MVVEKKIWPEYFEAVEKGDKNFELRLADWDIKKGDTIILREWDPEKKSYTGREISRTVTYLIKTKDAENWGMRSKEDIDKSGFQIIGFKPDEKTIKVLVFTEGTILMHSSGVDVNREERVKQVTDKNPSVHDYKTYIPIGNAIQKLKAWVNNGVEI